MYFDTVIFSYPASADMLGVLSNSFNYAEANYFRKKTDSKTDFITDSVTGEVMPDTFSFADNIVEHTTSKKFYTLKLVTGDINIQHNLITDRLHFNFSIPKFIYGHNVNLYPVYKNDITPQETQRYFYAFFRHFFKSCFGHTYIREHIEVERLDICFNYKFKNKENYDAMLNVLYLNFSRRSGRYNVYGAKDTFMIVRDRYSFKFYDKKKEFDAVQSPQLLRHLNKQKGKSLSDNVKYCENLSEHCNNTLRAEVSLRGAKIIDLIIGNYSLYNFSGNVKRIIKERKQQYLPVEKAIRQVKELQSLTDEKAINAFLQKIDFSLFTSSISVDSFYSEIKDVGFDIKDKYILERLLSKDSARKYRAYKVLYKIKPIQIEYSERDNKGNYYGLQGKYKYATFHFPSYYVLDDSLLSILYRVFEKLINDFIPEASELKNVDIKQHISNNLDLIKNSGCITISPKTLLNFIIKKEALGVQDLQALSRSTYHRNEKQLLKYLAHFGISNNFYKLAEHFTLNQKYINYV